MQTIAELTGNDFAVIITACGAAFVAVLGGIAKLAQVLSKIAKTTEHVNQAVNNRSPEEPTIRTLVESIDVRTDTLSDRIDDLRVQSRNWHTANVHRIDRLADAIGGINR